MNSEELEQSLKSEFESYLKTLLAEMKQETAEFQKNIEAEFEKHRSQIDAAFKGFATRFDSNRTFETVFMGSVGEHLRLARDEGARIAADAMVEAENLGQSPLSAVPVIEPVALKYDAILDAVTDIGSKESQSAILKSLVQHAENFAPRGAFFIVKSDHLSGWKTFGASAAAENAIRDIHFPVASDSILGAAISAKASLDNADRNSPGDAAFLNPLEFGEPETMFAVPLVARGRGVAVLYADHGDEANSVVNRDALETLVRVAGLTVELLASMQTAKAENRTVAPADFEDVASQTEAEYTPVADNIPQVESYAPATAIDYSEPVSQPVFEAPEPVSATPYFSDPSSDYRPEAVTQETEKSSFAFSDSVSFEGGIPQPEVSANPFDAEPPSFGAFERAQPDAPTLERPSLGDNPFAEEPYPGDEAVRLAESGAVAEAPVDNFQSDAFEAHSPFQEPVDTFAPPVESFEPAVENVTQETNGSEMIFDNRSAFDEVPASSSPFEQQKEQFEPAAVSSGGGFGHQAVEMPVIDAPVVRPSTPRLSDRNVDLPIEVPEEERRIHNDARRFARLLVSEIKLYNEKKVTEGREASDLYDRLREAIDRSREMYDKRVQPPVAAKFDYFHYELVNSLAEGAQERLGAGYPGASV